MAAKPNDKFEAAVKVIQSLPKNGSFQPSNELLLRFYGFYKQATQGQCCSPKPAFYDMVGKAKWDAWNKLGKLPREDAMLCYVDELKKIVEAMPHTAMVAEFVEKLGTFYELVDDTSRSQKPAKGGVPEGDVPNGVVGGVALNKDPAAPVNGRGEDTPPVSVSDDSSESHELSSDSSPGRVCPSPMVAASSTDLPTGACPPTSRPPDPGPAPPSPPTPPAHNGLLGNGAGMFRDNDGLTDSDADEFCDTSDVPDDQLLSVSRSSSPDEMNHSQITTMATIHAEHTDLPLTPHNPTHSLYHQPISELVTCRGGGESLDRQVPDVGRAGRVNQSDTTSTATASWDSQPPMRSTLLATGGAAGGGRGPGLEVQRSEVTEQIAIALVRLQQDMTSVLSRLNTLEALSVAQHQRHRSRQNSESEKANWARWWWPLPSLDARSVFFIMAWPLLVHWVLTLLTRRPQRRK